MKNLTVRCGDGIRCFGAVVLLIIASSGCTDSNNSDANSVEARPLPKLDFHRPKTLQTAVQRLREIHDFIVAKQPLPAPLEFDVLEVIHGTGASAHSHFYLANDVDEDHGHEEMESSEKRHVLKVDVFTEFKDIVNWLPKIAAATNEIDEKTWTAVKRLAAEMSNETKELVVSADNLEAARQAFLERTEVINQCIQKLEAEMPTTSAAAVDESS